jgi:MFS family permease
MSQVAVFKNLNFQLHWWGGLISQTGNFFTFIALPWLVLELTHNNPLIMSTVMATSSLPQAFFMLFGGVVADRFSPLKALFISRSLFVLALFMLAFQVYQGITPLWSLYLYAFIFGTLGALAVPASQSLLPSMVEPSQLGIANGLVMGAGQVSQIFGSILAGWLMWGIKYFRAVPELQFDPVAIAMAFSIDALGVCIAIVLMCFIKLETVTQSSQNFLTLFKQGIMFCWRDRGIALVLAYLMLISFFLYGVLMSGLPMFTKLHLGMSERAYGSLYAMLGAGTLAGIALGAVLRPADAWLGALVLVCDLLNGAALYALGDSSAFLPACLSLLVMGVCGGVVMVAGTTWFQKRTPGHLMGRVMSILMFCVMGLIPLSASIAGWLMSHYSIALMMSIAGVLIIIVALIGLMVPRIRNMGSISSPDLGGAYN